MAGTTTTKSTALGKASDFIALGVAVGSGEVVVRFFLARETVAAVPLLLALLANVACLGLLCLAVGGVAHAALSQVKRRIPRVREATASRSHGVATATALFVAVLATGGIGLDAGSAAIATATVGLLFAGYVTHHGAATRKPVLSPRVKAAVVVTWVLSLAVTGGAVKATHGELDVWLSARNERPTSHAAPNVLLIVLDTLRADRVGIYGGGDLTPNLDRFADSAIVYDHAISTAPWTLPTHASLFTGLYPDRHGVNWGHYRLEDRPTTIAELFREHGYDTFALSNNFLLDADNGFARGFDAFVELSRESRTLAWRFALRCGVIRYATGRLGLGRHAAHDAGSAWTNLLLQRRMNDSLAGDRPFFAFANYFEPHDPYLPPPPYLERHLTSAQRQRARTLEQRQSDLCVEACGVPGALSPEDVDLLAALYDAEVAYQDAMIGALIDRMDRAGLLETTWVIVTSDHGELFGEGGQVFHTAGAHYKLLHLPLIVRPPGGVEASRIDALVQPVDIFATLVELAGAALPHGVDRAYPLPLSPNAAHPRDVCVSETHGASIPALYTSQRRDLQADLAHWLTWITSVYADGFLLELRDEVPVALFNVAADPQAEQNVLDERGDVARALMEKLGRHRGLQPTGGNS